MRLEPPMTLSSLRESVSYFLFSPPMLAVSERIPILNRHCRGWRRTHPFDRQHGVETSGFVSAERLLSDREQAAQMNPYAGCQPSVVRRTLARMPELAGATFVDLGCGKGRALVIASEFPFRKVVGVELSPALVEVAKANAAAIRARYPERPPIEVQLADASRPVLTGEDARRIVYFLYNSFPPHILQNLVRHLGTQLDSGTEHIFFVYLNPFSAGVFDASPRFARWSAEILEYEPGEVPFGVDDHDAVIVWQSLPAKFPALPGAGRRAYVPEGTTHAQLEA
jgi:SAM-dependent methyltransferase